MSKLFGRHLRSDYAVLRSLYIDDRILAGANGVSAGSSLGPHGLIASERRIMMGFRLKTIDVFKFEFECIYLLLGITRRW